MNRWIRFLMVAGITLSTLVAPILAAEKIPYQPQGYVSDFANMISPAARQEIGMLADQLRQQHQVELAVVTVPTLGGRAVDDYATDLFAQWGIGKKGKDNGLLLLVSKQEHEIRVEVGYGLEDKVPDAIASEITRTIRDQFRQGDIDGGFLTGAKMLTAAVGGTLKISPPARRNGSRRGGGSNLPFIIFVLFFIFLSLIQGIGRMATGRRVVRSGSSIPWWLLLLMSGGGGGGSSWGGGGFSGGGGGFGGFGGGMSGGGGASSSW